MLAAVLLAVLAFSRFGGVVQGAEGDLDGSFNGEVLPWGDGHAIVVTPIRQWLIVMDMALQTDGKILVAGYYHTAHATYALLARYCRSGRLDDGVNCGPGGFGTDGIVRWEPEGLAVVGLVSGVAVQADGKILLSGSASSGETEEVMLVRYCPDGTLDDGANCGGSGFGDEGVVTSSHADQAGGLAVQADGKIVVGAGTQSAVLMRFCQNGRLDDGVNCGAAGFGVDGVVNTGLGQSGGSAHTRVTLQPDGKILMLRPSTIARFCANGLIDNGHNCGGSGFGAGGIFPGFVSALWGRLAVQADGKIVHVGSRIAGSFNAFFLGRLCPDGSPDDGINCGGSGFGIAGEVTTVIDSGDAFGRDVALSADGKIVAAGLFVDGPNLGGAVVRYCPDGRLDDGAACGGGGFGTDGIVTGITPPEASGTFVEAWSLALPNDGKVLISGCMNCDNGSAVVDAAITVTALCPNGLLDEGNQCGGVYSTFGPVTTDIRGRDQAHSMALQSDGKIVLAGGTDMTGANSADFALARYCPDGTLDDGTTCGDGGFGQGGTVTTNFASYNDFANGVAIQADGKIVAAGVSNQGSYQAFALARYCEDGRLDDGAHCGGAGFGTGGRVVTVIGGGGFSRGFAAAVVIQPDDKIVAAGFAGANFALARYCTDGRLDNGANCGGGGFGSGGVVTTAFAGGSAEARALALQSDGKLVAAGVAGPIGSTTFALARYCPDGRLDTGASCGGGGFGTGGLVITTIGTGSSRILGLVMQPDGKIVAAGHANVGGSNDFALARYCPDGALDNGANCGNGGFGSDGVTTIALSPGQDLALGVARQTDGKLVAVGYTSRLSLDFALVRLCPDGRLDDGVNCGGNGFGTGGTVKLDIAEGSGDIARAVAIQPDTRIVVAGDASGDFALARFIGSSAPPPPPGGVVFHILVIGVDPETGDVSLGPLAAGGCPEPISDCLELTVTGSFRVEGTILGLLPGSVPTVSIPVADGNGTPAGSRPIACSPSNTDRVSSCTGALMEPAIIPILGGIATVVTVLPDVAPPVTVASAAGTAGSNGWYRSDVMVTLTAADDPGGSGVDRTYYAVDGPCSPAETGSCLTYGGPFGVSTDGRHIVHFWSRDRAGNAEARQSLAVNIDATSPVVGCSASPSVLWPPNHKLIPVSVSVDVSDATSGSGGFVAVAAISSEPDLGTGDGDTPDDVQGFVVGASDTDGWLRAERSATGPGRWYTLTYEGLDMAGNSALCSTTLAVPHDRGAHALGR